MGYIEWDYTQHEVYGICTVPKNSTDCKNNLLFT